MKNIISFTLFILLGLPLLAQNGAENRLILTGYQYEDYPELTASFYLVDSSLNSLNFTSQQFLALDNGRELSISSLIDGNNEKRVTNHHVILFDAGISNVGGQNSLFSAAKQMVGDYMNYLDGSEEQVSLIAFSDVADLISDKTLYYSDVEQALGFVDNSVFSNLDAAFKFPATGLLNYLDRYEDENVSVLLITKDFNAFDTSVLAELTDKNVTVNTAFFVRAINPGLRTIVESTGGLYFDKIRSYEDTDDISAAAVLNSRAQTPYDVELLDILNCDTEHRFSISLFDTLQVVREFEILDALRPLIEADPGFLSFSSVLPGESKNLNVRLVARNSEIFIDSIRIENDYNGVFEITGGRVDQTIAVGKDQAHNVEVTFNPVDSAIVFTKLVVYSNACDGNEVLITGGFPNTPPNEETIQLLAPECGQTLIVGDTFNIEWTGVLPKDVIQLEYSVDLGQNWDTLATNVVDLNYRWEVPNTISDQCLVRAIQLWPNNIGRTLDLQHDSLINKAVFSADGSLVLTASESSAARLWNSNTGRLIREFDDPQGHSQAITDIMLSPDETETITASKDGRIIVWDTETGEIKRRMVGQAQPILDMDLTQAGKLISISRTSGSTFNSKIIIWDYAQGLYLTEYNDFNESFQNKWQLSGVEAHPFKEEFVLTDLTDRGGVAGSYLIDIDSDQLQKIRDYDTRVLGQTTTYGEFASISPDGNYVFISESKSFNKPGLMYEYETGDFLYNVNHTNRSRINSAEFFFDNERSWLLTGGDDGIAILWDAATGDSLNVFREHTSNITFAEFNFDASRVLTTSWDETAKIWNLEERDLQMDTTDCAFAISTAIIESSPLAIGRSVVRQTVDSVFTNFIFNDSDFAYDVFDIRIEGENANEFTILDGFAPYIIDAKSPREINISFTPLAVGERKAELIVDYPGNRVVVPLSGIGIDPGILQLTEFLDFGDVEIGESISLNAVEILQNFSALTLDIDSIQIIGIERDFFSYANIFAPSMLDIDDILTADFRFTPLEAAPFAATVKIYHNAPTSPTSVLLRGVGVPQRVDRFTFDIGSDIADPGEIVSLPLTVGESTLSFDDKTHLINFDLTFDVTVLEPLGEFLDVSSVGQKRTVNYTFPITEEAVSSGTIGNIDFRIAMGMDSISRLKISNLSYEGSSKVILEANSGEVKVANLCEEGGVRLFDGRGYIELGDVSPNPIAQFGIVTISLAEAGHTILYVLDNTGKKIKTLLERYMEAGNHEVNIEAIDLPRGSYFLVLQTPSDSRTSSFIISD